jgi:hypothetical protein
MSARIRGDSSSRVVDRRLVGQPVGEAAEERRDLVVRAARQGAERRDRA